MIEKREAPERLKEIYLPRSTGQQRTLTLKGHEVHKEEEFITTNNTKKIKYLLQQSTRRKIWGINQIRRRIFMYYFNHKKTNFERK
jgi:hypothetical protein